MLKEFREQLRGGLGMLLTPSAYNYLEGNVVVVNSRIMVAKVTGNPATTIIYAATVQQTARMTTML